MPSEIKWPLRIEVELDAPREVDLVWRLAAERDGAPTAQRFFGALAEFAVAKWCLCEGYAVPHHEWMPLRVESASYVAGVLAVVLVPSR